MKRIDRRTAIKISAAGVAALAFPAGDVLAQDAAPPFGDEFPNLESLTTGEWWTRAKAGREQESGGRSQRL